MIPAAPPGAVRFNPPPTWTAPSGFDPRRGHLSDPTWPAPPEGWPFWVMDPAAAVVGQPGGPTTTLPRGRLEGGEKRRLFITLGVIALVVVALVWAGASGNNDEEAAPGVGSCWTGGQQAYLVPCSSARAEYIVGSVVTNADQCPVTSPGYLEEGDAVLCLRPID